MTTHAPSPRSYKSAATSVSQGSELQSGVEENFSSVAEEISTTNPEEILPRDLSENERKLLEERLQKAVRNVAGQKIVQRELFKPGFKRLDKTGFVLVESAIANSELCQLLGGIIQSLCNALSVPLRVYEASYQLPDDSEVDQFLTGLLMSIKDSEIKNYRPSLKIDKKPYDLGKSCGFFLRLRGEVTTGGYSNVTLNGLKTSHRYFGNDSTRPTTEKERTNRKSPLEIYLSRCFARVDGFSQRWVDYYRLLIDLFKELRFRSLDNEIVKKIIDHYQKSFDDVRPNFERPIFNLKKGTKVKVQTGVRRPKKPNSSPTLLTTEFRMIIDPIISCYWSSLEHFKQNFKEDVRIQGYSPVMKNIHDIYESRFEVMRNFSNLTTRRLQEARNYGLLDAKSKKTDFTEIIRKQFLEKRAPETRVALLQDEINKLIPAKYLYSTLGKFLAGEVGADTMLPRQLLACLTNKIMVMYHKNSIGTGNLEKQARIQSMQEADNIKEITQKLAKVLYSEKVIKGRLNEFRKSLFTKRQLTREMANYTFLIKDLPEFKKLLEDAFWTDSVTGEVWRTFFVTKNNFKSASDYHEFLKADFKRISKEFKDNLESRDRTIFLPTAEGQRSVEVIVKALEALTL